MSYWGSKSTENDYAFDAVGVYVLFIKDRMFKDVSTVISKCYPEQGIVASIKCLRIIGEEFPNCLKVHFRRKDYEKAKSAFDQWYDLVSEKLPSEYKEAIRDEANEEFALFESRILG